MVLQNYVILQKGIPTRLHFTDHYIETIQITDRQTGLPAKRQRLVFDVDTVDARPVVAKYSTLSEKHASQFAGYLADKSYRNFDFVITQTGEEFRTSWTVERLPRGKS